MRKIALWIGLFVMALAPAAWSQGGGLSLQNFEDKNGTEGPYFNDVWKSLPQFESQTVHGGKQAVRITVPEDGGTVGVRFSKGRDVIDLTKAKSVSVWVFDTQGNNSVELRLKDAEGDGGSGPDQKALWSVGQAEQGKWTRLTWDLTGYPAVEGLHLDRIAVIELYEQNPGSYVFDDLEVIE
jgi:hypothetical protein